MTTPAPEWFIKCCAECYLRNCSGVAPSYAEAVERIRVLADAADEKECAADVTARALCMDPCDVILDVEIFRP